MAIIYVTASGTYQLDTNDEAQIEMPGGGNKTIEAANTNVSKIRVDFGDNDNQSDVVTVDLPTFAYDGLEIDVQKYDITDQILLDGGTITGVDPNEPSKMTFTYVGEDGGTYPGFIQLTDGTEKDFTDPETPIIVCFAQGTMIENDIGLVLVEDLRPGDEVATQNHGFQSIKWIGHRRLERDELTKNPKLRPIRIERGALGRSLPQSDLWVARQHRMLVSSRIAERMFGHTDVLVPAIKLVGLPGISIDEKVEEIDYFHILFDRHEIVFSNGAPSESLFTEPEAMKALSPEARKEIKALFPEIESPDFTRESALFISTGSMQKHSIERHRKNDRPALQNTKSVLEESGAVDGARTRDPRRDRPVL